MKALRFVENSLQLADVERPRIEGESTVRVVRSGICNTDLEIVRGYAGFEGTIGHEFVGVVEASPDRPDLVGKRVVGEINVGCGVCDLCAAGDPRHCVSRTVLGIHGRDGAHAEFVSLPSRNLIEVPDNVTDEQATFTEPLAAALGITERVAVDKETTIAVIGDGKLGLLCAFGLALSSQNIVQIGKHREKLAHAQRRGIETMLADEALTRRAGFDVVVEASGSESGLGLATDLVRPRGTIVLKSTFAGATRIELWRHVVDEISIVGSRCGRFAPALDAMASGRIDPSDLIADEFTLGRGVEAMAAAARSGILKVLLKP